jgi:hypothetical protein
VATRTVQGRSARVCLFAIGPNRCVELPDPERENGWAVVDTLVRLPKGTVAAKLYVYADGNERRDGTPTGVRTVTEYREISVLRLASSKATTIAASPPQSGRVELSAGSHLLDTVVDVPTPAIGPWSEVGDCNRRDRRSIAEVGLKATVGTVAGDDHAVLLEAGAHAACVTAAIQGLRDLVPFTLSFRYRTVRGSTPPRVCLLDPSTGTCRALRPLGTTRAALTIASNWTEVRYEITPGKETGQRLPQIYLYADAVDGAAATEYRDVRIDPLAGESVTIQTVAPSSATPPTLEWTQRSPARYHVKVSGVKAPFLLALADSWSPDWKVGGLPAGARIRQLRIDGYRNGWLIDTRGDPRDLDLTVEYVPARWGRRALAVSGATAVALLLVGALLVVRRRRRPSA